MRITLHLRLSRKNVQGYMVTALTKRKESWSGRNSNEVGSAVNYLCGLA